MQKVELTNYGNMMNSNFYQLLVKCCGIGEKLLNLHIVCKDDILNNYIDLEGTYKKRKFNKNLRYIVIVNRINAEMA